jgi:MFS transporter, PAT family, solute carrier family 33 (acetyl-CoA transportor), member 1
MLSLPDPCICTLPASVFNHASIHPPSPGPMEVALTGIVVKVLLSLGLWAMVQYTPAAYASPDEDPGMWFLAPLVGVLVLNEIAGNMVFISFMSFFSKVSDPAIGGSYVTLLATLANLGHKWPSSLSLYLLPKMTYHVCESYNTVNMREVLPIPCTLHDPTVCKEHGGTCSVELVRVNKTSVPCGSDSVFNLFFSRPCVT